MGKERESKGSGCNKGCGCSGCGTVLTAGIVLSLLGVAVGGGCSARIPFTESNISITGAIGEKTITTESLPHYVQDEAGGHKNFVNNSQSLTIGSGRGEHVFVIGKQDGAPRVDIDLNLRSK